MIKNINYNLLETITIISQSLSRYDTYIKDSAESKSCQDVWKKFKEQREKELTLLLKQLKEHIDTGLFPLK